MQVLDGRGWMERRRLCWASQFVRQKRLGAGAGSRLYICFHVMCAALPIAERARCSRLERGHCIDR